MKQFISKIYFKNRATPGPKVCFKNSCIAKAEELYESCYLNGILWLFVQASGPVTAGL